jgi:hypothetical protein
VLPLLCYDTSEMSCPYFQPSAPRSLASDARAAILPLGDDWDGVCCAAPEQPWKPDAATVRPLCNMGYARGACSHFPDDNGPDAVRFAISGDDGSTLRLYYVVERDHHPFAHGALGYAIAGGGVGEGVGSAVLQRQACAYAESYLRRKSISK